MTPDSGLLESFLCYKITNVVLKNYFYGLNMVKKLMESWDGSGTVSNKLMTGVCGRQQDSL